jgi:hypothetical protein
VFALQESALTCAVSTLCDILCKSADLELPFDETDILLVNMNAEIEVP